MSKLEELFIINCFLLGLIACFDSLQISQIYMKTLEVHGRSYPGIQTLVDWQPCLVKFLCGFKRLEKLSLTDSFRDVNGLIGGIIHHSRSLRHLTLKSVNRLKSPAVGGRLTAESL